MVMKTIDELARHASRPCRDEGDRRASLRRAR